MWITYRPPRGPPGGSLSAHSGLYTVLCGSNAYGHLSNLRTGELRHTVTDNPHVTDNPEILTCLYKPFFLHLEGDVAAP